MIAAQSPASSEAAGAHLTRVVLSIGTLDLVRFVRYEHAFPRHSHEHFTVGVFANGNGSLGYRGSDWRAFDGSLLAVPPDEVHTAEPLRGSGWTYRAMYPSVQLVAAALDKSSIDDVPAFFAEPIREDAELAAVIARVHRQLERGGATIEEESHLLSALRQLILRHGVVPERIRKTSPTLRAVDTAREYLHANFRQPVKLGDLARASGVSSYHLLRSFAQVVGMPPHAYLTQIRAHRARDLLLAGESPASAAYRCGFCDQSHLTRNFKKFFGVTPGAYLAAASGRLDISY